MDFGSLLAQMGGSEVTSARVLAPSAFPASAAATLSLQNAILLVTLHDTRSDGYIRAVSAVDTEAKSGTDQWHIQRVSDAQVVHSVHPGLQTKYDTPADVASLKDVAAPHTATG